MTEFDFLKSINDIDADLLKAAEKTPAKKKRRTAFWMQIAATAACVCMIAGLGIFMTRSLLQKKAPSDIIMTFAMDDQNYERADLNDYIRYGLVAEGVESRSVVSVRSITKADLGEWIGTIVVDASQGQMTCNVYHLASFPDDDSIVVIDMGNEVYEIFVIRE